MNDFASHSSEQETVSADRMRANLKRWIPLGVLVAALDQGTKLWVTSLLEHGDRVQVLPFFAWVRWHNEGAAFFFWPRRVDGSVGFLSSWHWAFRSTSFGN